MTKKKIISKNKSGGGEGLGLFADLRGAWQERGGVFEGGGEGLRPQCTLWKYNLQFTVVFNMLF